MSFKYIRITLLAMILTSSVCLASWAEGFSNQIDSVKVQSVDDKSVVVDVYIKSDDPNVKPEISSRKYKGDKYIIDLMQVTNKGGVAKDTSASSGLLSQKDVRVGNLPGGTARVLLNLNKPDVNVKEVRYHIVKDKGVVKPASSPVLADKKPAQAKQNKSEAMPVIAQPAKPAVSQVIKKEIKPQKQAVAQPENQKNFSNKVAAASDKQVLPSPQIVHKTDKPVKPVEPKKVTLPTKPIVIKDNNKEVSIDENIIPATYVKPASHKKEEPAKSMVVKRSQESEPVKHELDLKAVNSSPDIDETFLSQAHPEPKPTPVKEILEPGQIPINLGGENAGDVREVQADKGGLDLGKLFTSIGLALIVIVPLIVLTIWLINLFQKASGGPVGINAFGVGADDKFKIISSTTLGQGKSIHLVEIKGRQLVIGCTNNSINILTEFGDFDQFVEEQREEEAAGPRSEGKKDLRAPVIPATPKYKKSRPPLGSFADLYKDYQTKIDDKDLEDEY